MHDERAAAAEVGEQVDRRHRRAAFGADVPEHARDREVVDVVADVGGERAVLAPAGHARVHELRVARPARVGPDAEAFGDTGPEPFEQHVGLLAQLQHHLRAPLVLQVDADAAAAAVDHGVRRHEAGTFEPVATSVARSSRSTSAPMSASSMPANCTGPMFGSSMTRIPASGPVLMRLAAA